MPQDALGYVTLGLECAEQSPSSVTVTSVSPSSITAGDAISVVVSGAGATQGGLLIRNTSTSHGVIVNTWADTLITGTTRLNLDAGTYDIIVTDDSGNCGIRPDALTVTARTETLNRQGICDAIRDMFMADTSVLYGNGLLLERIVSDPSRFDQAEVEKADPYGLYIWAESSDNADTRMQNADDSYSIDLRFNATNIKSKNAVDQLDKAYERCKVLLRNEMQNGQYMSSYFSDSNARVLDIDVSGSSLPAPERTTDGNLIFTCEAFATILINRF